MRYRTTAYRDTRSVQEICRVLHTNQVTRQGTVTFHGFQVPGIKVIGSDHLDHVVVAVSCDQGLRVSSSLVTHTAEDRREQVPAKPRVGGNLGTWYAARRRVVPQPAAHWSRQPLVGA